MFGKRYQAKNYAPVQFGSPKATKRILDDLDWTSTPLRGHRWTSWDVVGHRGTPWDACGLALINHKIDTYVMCIVSSFCTKILVHLGTRNKNLTTLEKLFPRFIGSRSLSSFKLSRGVLACAYSGYVLVNVHWTTLWIRKSPQGYLCLGDYSTTARRLPLIAGVVITLVIPVNLLTLIRTSAILSDWYFGTRTGTCV